MLVGVQGSLFHIAAGSQKNKNKKQTNKTKQKTLKIHIFNLKYANHNKNEVDQELWSNNYHQYKLKEKIIYLKKKKRKKKKKKKLWTWWNIFLDQKVSFLFCFVLFFHPDFWTLSMYALDSGGGGQSHLIQ